MSHSSFSSEVPILSEPERPKSRLFHAVMVLGVCSALLWMAPAFVRSLRALVSPGHSGSVLPSLLEVSLTSLAVVALLGLLLRGLRDARMRMRSLRNHRRWEDVLREEEQRDASRHAAFGMGPVPKGTARSGHSAPVLRLVESTPWPLGKPAPSRQRKSSATQLGFARLTPLPNDESEPRRGADAQVYEPRYATPYPFSVWSFHDNLPDPIWESEHLAKRPWLWMMAVLVVLSSTLAFVTLRRLL